MPVLLLCYGDTDAKDLLRRAIEERYGARPLVVESLEITFEGHRHVKLGPVETWVPMDAKVRYVFPHKLRSDYTLRPLKLPVRRGSEACDGDTYYTTNGGSESKTNTEAEYVRSMRQRLWAMAAILLTPLSESFIKLSSNGDTSLTVENTQLGDTLRLSFRDDQTLEQVSLHCLNPEAGKTQHMTLDLSSTLSQVDDLLLPDALNLSWDDVLSLKLTPKSVAMNPTLADDIFTLKAD